MKLILLFSLIIFLSNCSKPKTVLICGDHICVNKSEAELYFKENLSIEVKIIDKKIKQESDLVELNLNTSDKGNKAISVYTKKKTNQELKTLSNEEIDKIKTSIKNKKKNNNKIVKQIDPKKKELNKEKINKKKIFKPKNKKITLKNVNKVRNDVTDICTILEKCSIDEISKYLLNQGKKKKFPDITLR